MRWNVAALAVLTLLLIAALLPPGAAAQDPARVTVMFDFGTGRVDWADVPLPEGSSAWNATVAAADAFGFPLDVTWYPFGVIINAIDGVRGSFPAYWHLLAYEDGAWNATSVGAADLPVGPGGILGWFLSADDPLWDYESPWPGPRPIAEPGDRHPVTTFRYDSGGSGLARDSGVVAPVLAWTYDTKAFEISGTPAVAGGVVYQPTWTGMLAVSEATGALLWKNGAVAGASSPALFGDRIYVGGRDGKLHVLARADGRELWNVTLQPDPVFSGITASPRVVGGKLYVGTFNETGGDGAFCALDAFTGAVAWSRPVSSVHFSSAAVWNGTVFVGLMGRYSPELTYAPPYRLLALDAETGDEEWFVDTNGSVAASPAIAGDTVFVTTKAGELFAVSLAGTVRWKATIEPSIASPAVSENTVVVGDGVLGTPGNLRAFSFWGEPLWVRPLSGPVSASPTIAGGLVFAATNEAAGRLVAVRLADGQLAWSEVLEPEEYILSSPVVHDRSLYIASDNGLLYAFHSGTIIVDPRAAGFPWWTFVAGGVGVVSLALAVVWVLQRRSRRGP